MAIPNMCTNCNKEPATFHYTEVINDKVTEYHLCKKCAIAKGFNIPFEKKGSIEDFLAGMFSASGPKKETETKKKSCSKCGQTQEELERSGRLGCDYCYTVFEEELRPLLKKIHGSNIHVGKTPVKVSGEAEIRRKIRELQWELKNKIEKEEYEEAAVLRDKIKKMEEGLQAQKK